jgi:chromosome segregation ATPase
MPDLRAIDERLAELDREAKETDEATRKLEQEIERALARLPDLWERADRAQRWLRTLY